MNSSPTTSFASSVVGIALLSPAAGLFGVLAYEPANLVSAFHLEDVVSEAAVVVVALFVVGGLTASGAAFLRRSRKRRVCNSP